MSREQNLARELRAIGVSKGETAELVRAARRLSSLRVPGMSAATRQRIEARLPFDIEPATERRAFNLFGSSLRPGWAAAGAFAAVAILVGAVMVFHNSPNTPVDTGEQKAHELLPQINDEQQIQQDVQQLQQLQEQPTVNAQELQKAKDNFRHSYELLQRHHSSDSTYVNLWKDYESQSWWTQTTGSGQSTPAPDTTQPNQH